MKWYQAFELGEKIFFWIAIVGTALLVIQIVLMLFSFGDGDVDFEGGDFDLDGDLSFFTVKGITAFLSFGGWTGLLVLQINPARTALAIVISLLVGIASMFLIALAMKGISKLQCDGTFDKSKLLGKEATVYVSIAPNRTGRGKITLTAQGAYKELDAVTDEEERIPVDARVIIKEVGADYMVVEMFKKEKTENAEEKAE